MKKIIFSTMIASLLAFVGCQNEELVNENTNNGGEKVILTANIQGAADSRVALTPDTENGDLIVKVAWNERGEKFKVYGYDSEYSDYYGTPTWFTQIAGTNQFEGTLPQSDNGTYLAVYGDDYESINNPLQYFLNGQDGTLNDCQSISTEGETFYLHYVLMRDIIADLSSPIEFEHETAILKPTFKVGGIDIDNTITQIVMGNVIFPTTTHGGIEEITIIPHLAEQIQSASGTTFTMDDDIYIHLPMVYIPDGEYSPNHEFTFTVTDKDNKEYTGSLTIPADMSIEAGKFYTANIKLTEACYLPAGIDFNGAITAIPNSTDVTAIEFVANLSDAEMDNATSFSANNMPPNAKYKIIDADGTNPKTLKICTDAEVFMFNADCYGMFQWRGNYLNKITSIKFNNCVNTENVMNMNQMFGNSNALEELDLSYFVTSNVINMGSMFTRCHNLTSLDIRNFNVNKVTDFSSMFYRVGNSLASGKMQIYVANPNPFADKENTSINSVGTKAEYVVVP